ncbi:TIR domain-containing protein [Mesorhizobium sp. M00.F.Ca.ET.217.01.1.1]|uniref:TIR domain-containing protein n=1 Tax=Mesorhizobium sp. M00.F.Ca.ET.217.01.1.1 TaxID=2500529 RepID=UPI001FDF5B84|nr:TIR domain-containing protein [Mesorhizobium sp. M00.F.Ca.ET.217.01.1.1]
MIFDGDQDGWAYRFMKGWNANDNMHFSFNNAHDLDTMTSRAQSEDYVKRNLRARMEQSTQVLALIGERTKNLYRFVRWELELALDLGLPIVAANINEARKQDDYCPPIIRDKCVVHVPFKMKAIQYALANWPSEYRGLPLADRSAGSRHYTDDTYRKMGL